MAGGPATLDRIAAAFLQFGPVDAGARALHAYDRWLAIQQSEEARNALRGISPATRHASPLFDDIRAIGKTFEAALLALLFDTDLGQLSRRYLVF